MACSGVPGVAAPPLWPLDRGHGVRYGVVRLPPRAPVATQGATGWTGLRAAGPAKQWRTAGATHDDVRYGQCVQVHGLRGPAAPRCAVFVFVQLKWESEASTVTTHLCFAAASSPSSCLFTPTRISPTLPPFWGQRGPRRSGDPRLCPSDRSP